MNTSRQNRGPSPVSARFIQPGTVPGLAGTVPGFASAVSWSARPPRSRPRAADALVTITGLAIALVASLASIGCDRPPPAPTPAPILVPAPVPVTPAGEHIASIPTSPAPPAMTVPSTPPRAVPSPPPAPMHPPASVSPPPAPAHVLSPAPAAPSPTASSLCVTEGEVVPSRGRASVREPTTRGYLAGSTGDSAALSFTYRGRSHSVAALASGNTRAQLGVKLRAQDSCNVIYVMWRIEPKSEIVVQVKRNDAREHRECGNAGYTGVRPSFRAQLPALGVAEWSERDGSALFLEHVLRAAIVDGELEVLADDKLVWRGSLPASARELRGPAGFRTDNVEVDLVLDGPRASDDEVSCPRRPTKA